MGSVKDVPCTPAFATCPPGRTMRKASASVLGTPTASPLHASLSLLTRVRDGRIER